MAHPSRLSTFPFLDSTEAKAMLAASSLRRLKSEEVVFDQGVPMRAIFVIERGSLRVELMDNGAAIPLATLYEGELFGEMSFVDGQPTSARVVAAEPAEVRIIGPELITQMSAQKADFEARLYRSIAAMLAQRLRLREMHLHGLVWQ